MAPFNVHGRARLGKAAGAATAVLAVAILLAAGAASAATTEFQPEPLRLNKQAEGLQLRPDLAVGPDDRLHAVWQDGRFVPFNGGNAVYYSTSAPDSRGRSFGDDIRVTPQDTTVDQQLPAVSVGPDGVVHVVWQERPRQAAPSGPAPTFGVWYTRSSNAGTSWSDPLMVSQPNARNNTRPTVAALPGDSAYVAWEMEQYPGTSVVVARVTQGSRAWLRDDVEPASDEWELNGEVELAVGPSGLLHAVWSSTDLDGGGNVIGSQVHYANLGTLTGASALPDTVALADAPRTSLNRGPSLAVTSRHGTWVMWTHARSLVADDGTVQVLADSVTDGTTGPDILAGAFTTSGKPPANVRATIGQGDSVMLAVGGVGSPPGPVQFTQVCSEYGCFADAEPVTTASGASPGRNASVATDWLGNVYVAWDDGRDCFVVASRNSPPGMPELVSPMTSSHEERPEFVWTFNDPDAGSAQSAFEVQYSTNPGLTPAMTSGPVVGSAGKVQRWRAPSTLAEGQWYWRVRTRDQLGLWSEWSRRGDFLLDRTAPNVTVSLNGGAEYTLSRTVVLRINATDNLAASGIMLFDVANDPEFATSSGSHEYPPAGNEFHWDVTRGEGIKVVFVRVVDVSGLATTVYATITYNSTPMLVHTPVVNAPLDEPVNITCEVLRALSVKAFVYYRVGDEGDFERLTMESNGSRFWAVIPEEDVKSKGVEYYIEVTTGGTTVTSPPTEPSEAPWAIAVYEPVDTYEPPIYSPVITGVGTLIIVALLLSLWYFKLRDRKK